MEEKQILQKAMNEAEKKFKAVLEKRGYDLSYFNLDLTGYIYLGDFHSPKYKIKIENHKARVECERID